MKQPTAFESLKAGKGRLYPMPKERRIEEWNRLKQYDWATKAHVPKYDGFLKFDADLIAELNAALKLHGNQPFRYNLKVSEQLGEDGNIQQLNVEYWIPTKPVGEARPAATSSNDIDFDDDLPF